MNLLPKEAILLQANEGLLTLTTHRVRLHRSTAGTSTVISMTLEAVASCALVTNGQPALLGAGFLLIAIGAWMLLFGNSTVGVGLILLGCILALAYVMSRKSVLEIASSNGRISVAAKSVTRDELVAFIDALEHAKLRRMSWLS
jgi:hypothetical protein